MGVRIKIIILLSLLAATISALLYFQFLRTQPGRQSSFFFRRTSFLEIREDTREGIPLPASSPIFVEKIVPSDARLFFAFGVPKEEWDPTAEPFRFTLSLEGREPEILYQKELTPSTKKQDRR